MTENNVNMDEELLKEIADLHSDNYDMAKLMDINNFKIIIIVLR